MFLTLSPPAASAFCAAISARTCCRIRSTNCCNTSLSASSSGRGPGGDAGLLLGVPHHVAQHLGRAQIAAGGFCAQVMDDRLAFGELAPFAVERYKDRLVQRIGQEC